MNFEKNITKDEALKLALEALEAMQSYASAERKGLRICDEAITAIKEALEQPQRTWVGITDEEITEIRLKMFDAVATNYKVYRVIENTLREKNK